MTPASLEAARKRLAEIRDRASRAAGTQDCAFRRYARGYLRTTDLPACLALIDALLAEREAWDRWGDQGVAPYVEAADEALARFGERTASAG